MAERIVSMHAAHRSGKDVVDGFLSRPSSGAEVRGSDRQVVAKSVDVITSFDNWEVNRGK